MTRTGTPVGRFAPSPTGNLHVGGALAALAAWASVRSGDGRFLVRIEDIDGPRVVQGASERQLAALHWLGLEWDGPVVRQSERVGLYDAALVRLAASERLFACRRSRRDLAGLASAPHGPDGPPYPAQWRTPPLSPDSLGLVGDAAVRFRVAPGEIRFRDLVQGEIVENVALTVGDVVLMRRDGVIAYQLAVVVDDIAQGVTAVVRGADLLGSTARQIQILGALGASIPAYAHVPLLVSTTGDKLSKRDGALSVDALIEAGVTSEALIGWLAGVLGHEATSLGALVAAWDWERVPRGPIVVPDDLASRLR